MRKYLLVKTILSKPNLFHTFPTSKGKKSVDYLFFQQQYPKHIRKHLSVNCSVLFLQRMKRLKFLEIRSKAGGLIGVDDIQEVKKRKEQMYGGFVLV